MDLNVFDVFLPIEIIFIIDAQIVPFLNSLIWLLNHFDTVIVVFDSFPSFVVIFTLIMYISCFKFESVISLRSPASLLSKMLFQGHNLGARGAH